MARVTADQAAAKWVQRLSAATQDVANGVQGVTTAPGLAAARNRQGYLAGVQASVDKWAARTSAVSLQEWQDKMVNVGVPRIATGAQANQGKMAAFMADVLPHIDAGVTKVKAMPNASLEDGIARSAAFIRHMATFKRRGQS